MTREKFIPAISVQRGGPNPRYFTPHQMGVLRSIYGALHGQEQKPPEKESTAGHYVGNLAKKEPLCGREQERWSYSARRWLHLNDSRLTSDQKERMRNYYGVSSEEIDSWTPGETDNTTQEQPKRTPHLSPSQFVKSVSDALRDKYSERNEG